MMHGFLLVVYLDDLVNATRGVTARIMRTNVLAMTRANQNANNDANTAEKDADADETAAMTAITEVAAVSVSVVTIRITIRTSTIRTSGSGIPRGTRGTRATTTS